MKYAGLVLLTLGSLVYAPTYAQGGTPCPADHAAVLLHAPPLVWPSEAPRTSEPVTVVVRLRVEADGTVGRVGILESSGDANLDKAALDEVRRSTYAPAIIACLASAANYAFRVNFEPGPAPCPVPHREAALVQFVQADTSHLPPGPALVVVRVTVSAFGSVIAASIVRSSGSSNTDRAAISAARASSYRPKIENCLPVVGVYTFRFVVGN